MDPITVLSVIMATEAVAQGAKGFFEYQSSTARKEALNMQMKENQINYQQKTIANYDQMQKIIEAQQAEMTVRGVSFGSPSYQAIAGNTYNIGMKQQRNLDLEKRINETNISLERKNVKDTLFAQLFGDVAQVGTTAMLAYGKTPKGG